MTEITEDGARRLLAKAKSPAADPERYEAQRGRFGWAFIWAGEARSVPLGARSWVVTDAGRAAMVRLGESASEALTRLAE